MIIAIGSSNPVKVQAAVEVIQDYPLFANAEVIAVSVPSEINEQPLSLDEIIRGAKARAKNALLSVKNSTYSFGIESGLFEAMGTQTGYLEACITCIYDGSHCFIGLSSGFEVPPKVLDLILDKNMDLSEACYRAKLTENPNLGSKEGLIGILSKGRLTRLEYTKQSIRTALLQLENRDIYTPRNGVKISS